MKYDHPEIIDPALEVIQKADPKLFLEMVDDDTWHVRVITKASEVQWDDFEAFFGVGAVARTPIADTPEERYTVVFMPVAKNAAGEMKVPVTDYVASTLVHEFWHHKFNVGEPQAYAFEAAFDRKLPARDKPILMDTMKTGATQAYL